MRIDYSVSGGLAYFPGLARPRTLDTDALPPEAARALTQAAAAARFFTLPAQVGQSPAGAADLQTHTLTIEEDGKSRTVRIIEPVTDPALQDLLQKVRAQLPAAPPA